MQCRMSGGNSPMTAVIPVEAGGNAAISTSRSRAVKRAINVFAEKPSVRQRHSRQPPAFGDQPVLQFD